MSDYIKPLIVIIFVSVFGCGSPVNVHEASMPVIKAQNAMNACMNELATKVQNLIEREGVCKARLDLNGEYVLSCVSHYIEKMQMAGVARADISTKVKPACASRERPSSFPNGEPAYHELTIEERSRYKQYEDPELIAIKESDRKIKAKQVECVIRNESNIKNKDELSDYCKYEYSSLSRFVRSCESHYIETTGNNLSNPKLKSRITSACRLRERPIDLPMNEKSFHELSSVEQSQYKAVFTDSEKKMSAEAWNKFDKYQQLISDCVRDSTDDIRYRSDKCKKAYAPNSGYSLSCFTHYVNEYRRDNPTGKIYISFTITEVLEKCAIRERPNSFFATIKPNRKAYHELTTEEQKLYKPYEVNTDFLDIIDRKSTIPVETVFPSEIKRPFFNRIL